MLHYKGLWLRQETYLDEEPVVLLPEVLDAVAQKRGSIAALSTQYHSALEQAIKPILPLVSYAKEIPQHPLNVTMVMFDLLMDSNKPKEEWKFVLMATGLLFVMTTGLIIGTLVKLC